MYILDERGTQIIASEDVPRFVLARKPDAALILASYGKEPDNVVIIGRYADEKEAQSALMSLFDALRNGEDWFRMPPSSHYDREQIIKDARTKRRGGS